MKLLLEKFRNYLSRCPICGCSNMDCWGRCTNCGSDMRE